MTTAVLFTDTDAIRAALGVTTKELPDSMLTGQQLETQMKVDLYSWLPTYQTLYDAQSESGVTADQLQIVDLLTLYCMYYGALRACEMILSYRAKVTDGKQAVDRFAVDWKALLETMKQRLADVRALLEGLLGIGTNKVVFFAKASPDYDPVTNI
jgi:hypothetical protein